LTPPFIPEYYREGTSVGNAEVPIVDADIDPEPGSINPFRVGARRDVPNGQRRYRVVYEMVAGDPVTVNGTAFRRPFFRGEGNTRYGAGIQYQGPWGCKKSYRPLGAGHGCFDEGQVWVRIYAPDRDAMPWGGVPFPKLTYQIFHRGEWRSFYIHHDLSAIQEYADLKGRPVLTGDAEPNHVQGPDRGWSKGFGIMRGIGETLLATAIPDQLDPYGLRWEYLRDLDLGAEGRGEDQPPPMNYEHAATEFVYADCLGRGMSKGNGKVVVLTGRLPTTPRTRNGEPVMAAAQARYWSLTGYLAFAVADDGRLVFAPAQHSLMDDEITTDSENRYIIAFSSPEDRPRVTSVNLLTLQGEGHLSIVRSSPPSPRT
jgi:hypothetical protein